MRYLIMATALAVVVACSDDDEGVAQGSAPPVPAPVPAPAPSASSPAAPTGEALSAGSATGNDRTRDAFTTPMPTLTPGKLEVFEAGKKMFAQFWNGIVTDMGRIGGSGPLKNANTCTSCHERNGRGEPVEFGGESQRFVGVLIRISIPGKGPHGGPLPEPVYGEQIQSTGRVDSEPPLVVEAEALPEVDWTDTEARFQDGEKYFLRTPRYRLGRLGYGELDPQTMMSPRAAPQLVGMGLLEAIPEDAILANSDPEDANRDGISGRPNRVWDYVRNETVLGRFGWKANQPTLHQINAGAFLNDLGLTTSLFPKEPCTQAQTACLQRPTKPGPDVTDVILLQVDEFLRTAAVPPRAQVDNADVKRGRALFDSAGCAKCHASAFTTSDGIVIHPFTDLLLHDMGPALADNRPDFEADGQEWRTPPLWGIGLVQTVNDHSYLLHDGRARGFAEAILWHGGEAKASRDAFAVMPSADRYALDAFLRSL